MLTQLRKRKTMKRILWTLIILITPPFVFWGIGSALRTRDKGPTYAGTAFGKRISLEEYTQSLQGVRDQAIMIYGNRLDEVSANLDLNRQAWDRLILVREAKKKNIRVSDQEVIAAIEKLSFLQSKGGFDKRAYDMVLDRVFKVDARQFEEEMRGSLTITKLRDLVLRGVTITDQEVRLDYAKDHEQAVISYLAIPSDAMMKRAVVNEKSSKKYYEENTESFKVGEQATLEFAGFEFSDYEKDITISDTELKTAFEKIKDEVDPKKGFDDIKESLKSELILNKAKSKALAAAETFDSALTEKTKTFEQVAKENNITIKETGFFAQEGLIPQIGWFPEVQEKAFALAVGERSGIITSKTGYAKGVYIIRLKAKKPPYIPSYPEVKARIDRSLREKIAMNMASKEAARLHKKITQLVKDRKIGFDEAARRAMHPAKRSEPFTRNGYIQGIGAATELGEGPFTMKTGDLSPVRSTRSGYCIFSALAVTPIDEEAFKKEKDELTKKGLEAKKNRIVNEWYEKLLAAANIKNNMPPEK
ncbi:MAG: SurA N-terminal domain-containing protein [Candidatus Omnitrophota bacterium]